MRKLLGLTAVVLAFISCGKTPYSLPTVNGSKYEILIVMNDTSWKEPSGRALVDIFDHPMEGLPQDEPVMSIIHVNRGEFTDFLKPSRNILIVETGKKYVQPKVVYTKDTWAQPQSMVKITAPSDTDMERLIASHGKKILDYFLTTERNRAIQFDKQYINKKARTEIEQMFGIQIDIPSELNKVQKGKDFYWITNDNPTTRKDIVIYTYPYTDKKMFTRESLIAKRDSVMKNGIQGEFEGSYMGTETVHSQPALHEIWVNGEYCAELNGLWKMFNGASMGGPFYSHSRLDVVNNRIVTVEGYIFAPGTKKRNHIRQLESVIYTTKLPQEINALNDVEVVAKTKK